MLFGQLLNGLKGSIRGYVAICHDCVDRKVHALYIEGVYRPLHSSARS